MKERLRRMLLDAGACEVGFSRCEPLPADERRCRQEWLDAGCNASMDYLARNTDLRDDPAGLLEGCRTVISLAFPYRHTRERSPQLPRIARYALVPDYHKALRKLLKPVLREFEDATGAHTRVCIDSAPVAERFRAVRAGIGRRGLNGCLITPSAGSFVFLAEILTDLELEPDEPIGEWCLQCGACLRACPGAALRGDGTLDARRCLSYLTIEHSGPFTPEALETLDTPQGRHTLFGCDICQDVCPHNRPDLLAVQNPAQLAAFALPLREELPAPDRLPKPALPLREELLTLDAQQIADMTREEFDTLTAGTSLRRAGYEKLRARTLRLLSSDPNPKKSTL